MQPSIDFATACKGVDMIEEHAGEFGVVSVKSACQGFPQRGTLWTHLAEREIGQHLGVALAGDERFEHRPR
jgi:hypothetical protein